MTDRPTAAAVTAVWRRESVRLVAVLTRMTRDLELAEDLAQDALVTALERWPDQGVPANPGAWLMAVAKRRAIDQFRRNDVSRRRTAELARGLEEATEPDLDEAVDRIDDDVLRLAFLCCHPALPPESRAALTLRLVGGLTTQEIARAYLVKDATMGQRISRAKRLLAESGAELENPTGAERRQRLADVMAVVYLVFNEGYAASSGEDWTRPDLCLEAMRLARMLAHLAPDDAEVHGLHALLELQGSRLHARRDPDGTPILLEAQDRRRWDQLLIRRGLAALDRADELARAGRPVGSYVLQAAIAACHARARRPEDTDWPEIARLYDVLARAAPGPVVEVNRAVAHGRAHGPDAGLAILEAVARSGTVAGWHLVPAVRGDLLERAGRRTEAAAAFRDAAALTRNADERSILLRRSEENGVSTMSLNNVPGEPIWIELFTPDTDAAKAFYGGLFGWTATDGGDAFGGYITFERDGQPVAGCMKNDGTGPSAWSVYLESNDAAATVEMAKANGGQVIVDAMQVGDFGHMAVVTDPAGAAVGVWQPKDMPGFSTRAEDGAPAWFEVLSSDYDAVIPFYENVFGWDTHTMSDTPEFRYTTLGKDQHALAGIMDARQLLAGRPSYWNFYLQVPDTDAAIARAKDLGGTEVMGPDETPYGRLATIGDPTGVSFMVMGPTKG